ncbi:MAG: ABC transporter substrate-binding protein [Bryobacterales bacterium]|nr:ABC transporter substrate-binding protein [Bryobacterales bacterium]
MRVPVALGQGAFPRHALDAFGKLLGLPIAPRTLGSQALTTDEFLFAVVPGETITVVSPYATDPQHSHVSDVAKSMDLGMAVDVEAVALRRPELMLVSHTSRADYAGLLRAVGVEPFRMMTIFSDLESIADSLEVTGHLSGQNHDARREVARLRERIAAARALRRPGTARIKVLAYSGYSLTYGRGSLFDHIVTDLGAVNLAAERGVGAVGAISSEQVAAWNPDWIVAGLGAGQDADAVRARLLGDSGVAVSTAGHLGQVLLLESRTFGSMSHHAVVMMERIAEAIHGRTAGL